MDRTVETERGKRAGVWRRAAAGLAALALAAAPARALTLEEAFAEAVRTNPDLRASREAARAVHEGVPLARASWMPTVEAQVLASRTRIGSALDFSGGFANPSSAPLVTDQRIMTLSATQNLYRGGRNPALVRRADQEVLQAHAAVEDTEQLVLLRVATAYLDVLRAERTVELRRASLAAFEARVRETEAQFAVGDRTAADRAQALAERDVAAAEVAAARADLETQRSLFAMLAGVEPRDLTPPGEPAGLPPTLEEAIRRAEGERPAVRAAGYAASAAGHAVRAVSGELGPRVDLRGTVTRTLGQGQLSFLPNSTDVTVGVQVSMPIYQAGAVGARLRQAHRVEGRTRNEQAAARREAAQRASAAWLALRSARERLAALRTAVEASRTALAGIRREADVGERTTREVLDAERRLVSRQVDALGAERDAVVGAYRLLEAVGGLTARGLGIAGGPDLEQEARDTRGRFSHGFFSRGAR